LSIVGHDPEDSVSRPEGKRAAIQPDSEAILQKILKLFNHQSPGAAGPDGGEQHRRRVR